MDENYNPDPNYTDPQGYDPQGYNPQGYDPQGYDPQGYNPQGQNMYQPEYMPQNQQYIPPDPQYMPQQYPPQMQQPYMQGAPQQIKNGKPDLTPEENSRANLLCIISAVCMFIVPIMSYFFSAVLNGISGDTESSNDIFSSLASLLSGVSHLAAWALMIYVRIRYSKNIFGKILMIIYLGILVLVVIGIIILIVSCISCVRSCPG